MKQIILLCSFVFAFVNIVFCTIIKDKNTYLLSSPKNVVSIRVTVSDSIRWSVYSGDEMLVAPSAIALVIKGKKPLGVRPVIKKAERHSVDRSFTATVPVKSRVVKEDYNELRLHFLGHYILTFRAYDEGVAYRFETDFRDSLVYIDNEVVDFNLPADERVVWGTDTSRSFLSHFELLYTDTLLSAIKSGTHCGLPLYLQTPSGKSILLTEADLHDYSNLFLFKGDGERLSGGFPKVILRQKRIGDRGIAIVKNADYTAATRGSRSYPWRCVLLSSDDKGLIENNLVYKLAAPERLKETGWIKPGKVAWDWWNANNIFGVPFRAGINTDTYKYYIDFASQFHLPYIILDEGWSKTTWDIVHASDCVDIAALVAYGKQKNVGVILWTLWEPLDKNMEEVLRTYHAWGVSGIKVDFMARADQYMVNFYERVASTAAKYHLLVDLHGAYKPVGLNRTYPNVLSYESVRGLENCKWSEDITPRHDVTLPFTRMAAGPMDYTPGAMDNATRKDFRIRFDQPMSQGTRAHQAAMYVVYESPLQMLADSPSKYLKDSVYTAFIAMVPVTWDTTVALAGKLGSYVAVARRHGNRWYIGAMNNWDKRSLKISLSFLTANKTYDMQVLSDGVNADRYASDYNIRSGEIKKDDTLQIDMQPGGGWSAIISEK